ncbi:MAG TPA: hypothetical protein VFG14_19325, partial [Chthoniobacteraceae bacterium]|nr:hypothetical protein [Chthoniobacteraceae bacterium]
GAFSGSILLDTVKTPVKGILAADGTFTGSVSRPDPLEPLVFTLKLDVISNRMVATASDSANSYAGILARTLDVDSLIRPTPHRGKYTLLTENNETGPTIPGGTGFGTMSVTGSGAVSLVGKLGDGTPFMAGSALDSGDNALLFVKAYSRDEGYLAGMVAFRVTDTSDATGPMTWHKPPRPNHILYPGGFTTAPSFLATRYYMPSPPDFYYLNLGVSAMITVGDKPAKELRDRISAPFSLLAPKATGDKTHVTFDPETGLFRGAFFDGAIRYPLEGALYQYNPARAGGLGFSQNGTVKVSISNE